MQLKDYQLTAIDKLLKITRKLLRKDRTRVCVLKAPTGSGKTIMVAEYLRFLSQESLSTKYAFIWISGNKLHEQSRNKIANYLESSCYTFSYLEEIQDCELKQNEIVFVNWHSLTKQKDGEWTNVFMRDNEGDRNLPQFIRNTKEKGLEIILIVDESHYHYWSTRSQNLVRDVIAPKLTLEVSATPKLNIQSEDIVNEEAGMVVVKFEDVVKEGMIKSETIVNEQIGQYADFNSEADEVIISASIEKLSQLKKLYKQEGAEIKPLLLIQLPSEGEKSSALDVTKSEAVETILENKGITTENGRLGIWLSERKENLDDITSSKSEVDVLIFKQAIALGWDCPRAQILVMFREIESPTFEIQTVGRILRMPEAKHYENDILNKAYVYTNLPQINIAEDKESIGFFSFHRAVRKEEYQLLKLPSIYLRRIDYGDLTLKFRKLFIEEANKYFGIQEADMAKVALEKADIKLDLKPEELTQPVISDAIIKNIDELRDITGEDTVNFTVSEEDVKAAYELTAKAWSRPYAPVRSHTKIQQAIYDWFDKYLGYEKSSRLDIQRIVVCSEVNQRIFLEIIETAKERFEKLDKEERRNKRPRKESLWEAPEIDYFNENFEKVQYGKYILNLCYLAKDRSKPEQEFEKFLENSKNHVLWWYKNGVLKENYFAISYLDQDEDITKAFYLDYIVQFKDGITGIFDTKSGITIEAKDTEWKSNALQNYIKDMTQKGRKIRGGIVDCRNTGFFVFKGVHYNSDKSDKGWERLEI